LCSSGVETVSIFVTVLGESLWAAPTLTTLSATPVVSVSDWLETLVTMTELVEVSTTGLMDTRLWLVLTVTAAGDGSPLKETTESLISGISSILSFPVLLEELTVVVLDGRVVMGPPPLSPIKYPHPPRRRTPPFRPISDPHP